MSSLLDPTTAGSPAASPGSSRPRWLQPAALRYLLRFVALAVGVGALAGVVWWRAVDLPGYLVGPDGAASTSERGLAAFVAGDAWFALLAAIGGLALGWVAWRRLGAIGWPMVLVVAMAALAAALVCWLVGHLLGPSDFNQRLATARPGDLVRIQLTLRARVSLLVWPFAATVPVLVGASLGRDDEEPPPRSARPDAGRVPTDRLASDRPPWRRRFPRRPPGPPSGPPRDLRRRRIRRRPEPPGRS